MERNNPKEYSTAVKEDIEDLESDELSCLESGVHTCTAQNLKPNYGLQTAFSRVRRTLHYA